jgi:hypothetical protein
MMDARSLARLLNGDIAGRNQVYCPGPGHSHKDRSLSVRLNPDAPDGFDCFSHSGDDWRDCRNYVQQRLGLPAWRPGDGQNRTAPRPVKKAAPEADMQERTEDDQYRIARAVELSHNPIEAISDDQLITYIEHIRIQLDGRAERIGERTDETADRGQTPLLLSVREAT